MESLYRSTRLPMRWPMGRCREPAFRHYLVQDYLFLIEFARAYALAVYKSPTLGDMREAAAVDVSDPRCRDGAAHQAVRRLGVVADEIETAPAAAETLAYTRYVLDTGMRGDLLALKVALSPCVIGYAEIATRLAKKDGAMADTNPYPVWIGEYAGDAYQEIAAAADASSTHSPSAI